MSPHNTWTEGFEGSAPAPAVPASGNKWRQGIVRQRSLLLACAALVLVLVPSVQAGAQITYSVTGLGTTGPYPEFAAAMNNAGQVMGTHVQLSGGQTTFLWTPKAPNGIAGTYKDVFTWQGDT